MPRVRGSLFLNTFSFLSEIAGTEAPQRVLDRLPFEVRGRLERPIREPSWGDFDDLLAYMRAAQELFGRDDPLFFRRMGYFSGQRNRQEGGFGPMAPDPGIAVQMGRLIWMALYDAGWVEVIAQTERTALVRIHDFPADAAHCLRMCGALEGLLTEGAMVARTEEIQCTSSGAPHCEFRVSWV